MATNSPKNAPKAAAPKAALTADEALASKAETGTFRTVGPYPLIDPTDPDNLVTYAGGGAPSTGPRTKWVKSQLAAGALEEVADE